MSDEEDESMSDGFSASEEEWQPAKDGRGGESSDDDDSDFEEVAAGNKSGRSSVTNVSKKDSKLSGVLKQQSMVKRRKPAGQSLRAKLYNKYRPPPKTLSSPTSGQNSPSASTSKGNSKNYQTPNEANDSDSDGSVCDNLLKPHEIDFQSSFFQNLRVSKRNADAADKPPIFDCNAGLENRSDSDSEDNNESSHEEHRHNSTGYNFHEILENANSMERMKHEVAKIVSSKEKTSTTTNAVIDVNTLLALGEKQLNKSVEVDDEESVSKLSKTKSTRIKRHTKTRPISTVAAGDTDDSDFEEVAGRKRF